MQTFEETGLQPDILRAITEMGFENPTPIQEKTISHLLGTNRDLVGLAQTGTGKTAAFSLPVIQQIDVQSKDTQALILCPTRELCMQVASDVIKFSKYIKGLSPLAIYGGANIEQQIRALKKGAQIVAGTPGRVNDLIRRGKLDLTRLRFLVLDEADEMLNMGFKDELDNILETVPKDKQTLLFSATMPKEIARIARQYMNDPEEMQAGKKNAGADTVNHYYYMVAAKHRYLALKRIVDINPNIYGLVFCRTRMETKDIADKLIEDGYNADALHGDLSQAQRDLVMQRFRQKSLQVLVATDVAARGLDVNNLTHVINYNLPDDIESYTHRSGRTGRAGRKGTSIAIIHSKEKRKIKDIEKIIGKQFEYKEIPDGKEICEKQLFHLVDNLENTIVENDDIEEYLPPILQKLDWLSKEEIIKRLVAVEFNRFNEYYKNAEDLNVSTKNFSESRRGDRDRDGRRERRSGSRGFGKMFMSAGSKDGMNKGRFLETVNEVPGMQSIDIGKIEILKNFTFFEVEKSKVKEAEKALQGLEFRGKRVGVEIKTGDENKGRRPDRKPDYRKKGDRDSYPSKRKRRDRRERY